MERERERKVREVWKENGMNPIAQQRKEDRESETGSTCEIFQISSVQFVHIPSVLGHFYLMLSVFMKPWGILF